MLHSTQDGQICIVTTFQQLQDHLHTPYNSYSTVGFKAEELKARIKSMIQVVCASCCHYY